MSIIGSDGNHIGLIEGKNMLNKLNRKLVLSEDIPSFQDNVQLYNDLLAAEILSTRVNKFIEKRPIRVLRISEMMLEERLKLRNSKTYNNDDVIMEENINPLKCCEIIKKYSNNNLMSENIGEYEICDPFSTIPARCLTLDASYLQKNSNSFDLVTRKIPKIPYKILDAPNLQDDFYLNLIDWSTTNILAVGLTSGVCLWSASTGKIINLMSLNEQDLITSVSWTQQGHHLAIGTRQGTVQIWDIIEQKKVRTLGGHRARVGSMDWCGPILASGGRDHTVLLHDVREKDHWYNKWCGHKQEVCGVKWSPNEIQLATGGNDNKLLVWGQGYNTPICQFSSHTAAVKALSWSPHQSGLLASGGGTADRHIRIWNTITESCVLAVDTGSQVCNIAWSRNANELVSTHGYSLNQVILWKWPLMQKIATLTGHTYRVLYLAVSPDGKTISTGAGDETLRFWQIFPSGRPKGLQNLAALSVPHTATMR